ncbi:hypothetical protein, partial [Streptomyces sp. MBT67]|uniref:hypothetical protein n=1 Tax=Streptomyces sp. MBT67 TaxID=1488397 RepID=UPI0035B4638F
MPRVSPSARVSDTRSSAVNPAPRTPRRRYVLTSPTASRTTAPGAGRSIRAGGGGAGSGSVRPA